MDYGQAFDIIDKAIRDLRAELSKASHPAIKAKIKAQIRTARLLEADLMDEEAAGAVSVIAESRKRLEKVVKDLKDIKIVPTIPQKPKPKPVDLGSVNAGPVPKKNESELSEPEKPLDELNPNDVTASPPEPQTGPNAELTEAHLIGLFRRSQFPIRKDNLLVFGLRGCLPVNYGGTDFATSHFVKFSQPNYLTMMCTIGLWRPGKGFALFPGSTVPYGPDVDKRAAAGGVGVNQIGRGRYRKYFPGWHTSKQRESGHWALRQGGAITLQRTRDSYPYDLLDKWQEGKIAGDNIHCARSMGPEGRIPESKYSSLGCQVIAGTVINGDHDSEAGPWAKFISNFKGAGAPRSVDYVLFDGAEAERMIADHNAGSSIILRVGSAGPHVVALQKRLAIALNRPVTADGDFGVGTFRAIIDFQEEVFGPEADDGIVGGDTAIKLGLELPQFDFDAAISGKETPNSASTNTSSSTITVPEGAFMPETGNPLLKKHFSGFAKRPTSASKRVIYDRYMNYFKTPECWFWLEKFGIAHNPNRMAHFFAQAAHETGNFSILRENLNYTTPEAVNRAWGARYKKDGKAFVVANLLRNPRAIGKWAYNGREGNRTGTDDGYDYRGGGIFQTTHRNGYRSTEKKLRKLDFDVPLEANPSLIEDPRVSFPAACFEWQHLGANELADAGNIKAISRGLNRGKSKMHGSTPANGEPDRIAKLKKIGSTFA